MPDPQRTEGGGKEGEDSMSSVSLELISRVMEEKSIFQSDMHIKIVELIQILGHKSIYGPLNVLNVGPQSKSQYLPSKFGKVTVLHGLGPPSMGPSHKVQNPLNGLLYPM
ncbi:hypothetical protein O181_030800 [Austropuccinia psidii MF-1]|uniref:Uncharacterized protein n=1 Tax=Austropuccinia psidii MF-1 TaxID=1389203 RepID=A0A9Q3CWT7_9BASI|nr:hypothetical protein [Austropuccinia psidii MF-1]